MNKVSLEMYKTSISSGSQYPVEFMEKRKALKLEEKPEGPILIGLGNPDDELLKEELGEFHDRPVEFVQIDTDELAAFLSRELMDRSGQEWDEGKGNTAIQLDKLANDAPVVNLVNNLFIEAIRSDASDIHIEGQNDKASVRYRIDGILVPVRTLPAGQFPAVSSRIKIMANLNIMERRLPQDGRISLHLGNVDIDMRISIVPIAGGESIVLRLLNRNTGLTSLEELGFSRHNLEKLKELTSLNSGLVLFTGPTGSGKTTSLNAIIRQMNAEENKIITIEDPVESRIPGISQIQTNEDIGLSFHSLLRRVLRQDPNIVMVGEIRDSETAKLAVRASLTGHLVFSSLHTNDAVSTVNRLIDMGIEPYLLGAVMRGAVSQRLVRRLCPVCRKKTALSPGEKEIFRTQGLKAESIYKAEGCPSCGNTGYSGRTAVAEILLSEQEVEKLIVAGAGAEEFVPFLTKGGSLTIFQDALKKISEGLTTLEEIERVL